MLAAEQQSSRLRIGDPPTRIARHGKILASLLLPMARTFEFRAPCLEISFPGWTPGNGRTSRHANWAQEMS
eukprot:scaffold110_cov315-Pavlova_lutheri.AAC.10